MGLLITLDLSTSSFPTFSLPPLARGFTHLSRSFSSGFPRGFRVCFRWGGHLGRERSMFYVKRLFALLPGIRLIGSRPPYGRLRAPSFPRATLPPHGPVIVYPARPPCPSLRFEDDLVLELLEVLADTAVLLHLVLNHLEAVQNGRVVAPAELRADGGGGHFA